MQIPFSCHTTERRIFLMTLQVCCTMQWHLVFALDESTDISETLQVVITVRYILSDATFRPLLQLKERCWVLWHHVRLLDLLTNVLRTKPDFLFAILWALLNGHNGRIALLERYPSIVAVRLVINLSTNSSNSTAVRCATNGDYIT